MKHKNKEKSARANPARAERRCSRYATYLIKIFIYYNYEGGALWEKFFLDFEILFFLVKTSRKSFFVFKKRSYVK